MTICLILYARLRVKQYWLSRQVHNQRWLMPGNEYWDREMARESCEYVVLSCSHIYNGDLLGREFQFAVYVCVCVCDSVARRCRTSQTSSIRSSAFPFNLSKNVINFNSFTIRDFSDLENRASPRPNDTSTSTASWNELHPKETMVISLSIFNSSWAKLNVGNCLEILWKLQEIFLLGNVL